MEYDLRNTNFAYDPERDPCVRRYWHYVSPVCGLSAEDRRPIEEETKKLKTHWAYSDPPVASAALVAKDKRVLLCK